MDNNIFSKVIAITPEFAKEILETKNTKNRPMNQGAINRYAQSMTSRTWKLNGQCIVFAEDGSLLDGQNRLQAVVKAKVSVPMLVMYNVPDEARPTIDLGIKRSTRDILYFNGYRNSNIMAPVVRLAFIYDILDRNMNLRGKTMCINNDIISRHAEFLTPDVEHSVRIAANCKYHLQPSVLGFCHLIFARKHKSEADEFMHLLKFGTDLKENHPALVLRKALHSARSKSKKSFKVRIQIALYFKAWNAFIKGKKITELSWDETTDKFPKVK